MPGWSAHCCVELDKSQFLPRHCPIDRSSRSIAADRCCSSRASDCAPGAPDSTGGDALCDASVCDHDMGDCSLPTAFSAPARVAIVQDTVADFSAQNTPLVLRRRPARSVDDHRLRPERVLGGRNAFGEGATAGAAPRHRQARVGRGSSSSSLLGWRGCAAASMVRYAPVGRSMVVDEVPRQRAECFSATRCHHARSEPAWHPHNHVELATTRRLRSPRARVAPRGWRSSLRCV